jgi:hypothetical protein
MSARICISSSYRFSISSCVGPHLPETRLTRSLQAMLSTRLAAVALSVALLLLAGQCKGYQHISHSSLSRGRSTSQAGKPIVGATALRSTPTSEEVEMSEEVDIFGAEFIQNIKNEKNGIKTISFEDRQRVMGGYTKVRTTILADAVFIGVLGISLTWFFRGEDRVWGEEYRGERAIHPRYSAHRCVREVQNFFVDRPAASGVLPHLPAGLPAAGLEQGPLRRERRRHTRGRVDTKSVYRPRCRGTMSNS